MIDSIHPEALRAFDARATALLASVVAIPPRPKRQRDRFTPDVRRARPVTDADIIGDVEVGGVDARGREVALYFFDGTGERGIVGDAYQQLATLADRMQRQRPLQFVSRAFIIRTISNGYATERSDQMIRRRK